MTREEARMLAEEIAAANRGGSTIGANSAPVRDVGTGDAAKSLTSLSNPVESLKRNVEESAGVWRQASNIGIGFNNDAVGLRTSIAATRMGTEEWGQVIKTAGNGLSALGGTVNNGARAFNQLSREFSNTDGADQLRKMGYTTKEYNEVLALSVSGKKNIDMNDKASRESAIAAATELATEMDKVAQLTGVSRKEQQEALAEKQKNARVQVTIDAMVRAGGKDASDAYDKMKVQLKGLGLDKLGDEIYTGQALSKKAQEQLNALGPAGTELRNSIAAVREAKTGEERAAAEARLRNAQAQVAAFQETETYRELVRRGEGPVADAAREAYVNAKTFREGAQKTAEAGKLSTTAAIEANRQATANAQAGKDAQGNAVAGAKTTEAYVLGVARIKDTNVVLADSLKALNDRVGRTVGIQKIIDAEKNVKPATGYGTAKKGEMVGSAERGGLLPEAMTKVPGLITNAQSPGDALKGVAEIGRDSIKEGAQTFMDAGKELFKGDNFKTAPQFQGRANGSLGSVGKLIEDFGAGTPMMLHGREGVITEKQLTSLMGSLKNVAQNVSSAMPTPAAAPATEAAPVSAGGTNTATLDDLNTQLIQLNKFMGQMTTQTADLAQSAEKQYRVSKKMQPDVNLR